MLRPTTSTTKTPRPTKYADGEADDQTDAVDGGGEKRLVVGTETADVFAMPAASARAIASSR